ncbi:MAG: hypothetical protein HZA51_14505 [Planctomycetes bacterium]|nr:hypothetical protein [Planctomycetota bacterium]
MAVVILASFWLGQFGCAGVIGGKAAMFVGKKVYEKVSEDKTASEDGTQN